jgi:hypothetical protein
MAFRAKEVLTQIPISGSRGRSFQPNHLLRARFIAEIATFADKIARRSMIVKKAKPYHRMRRAHLAGSGWKKKSQTVCGIKPV